MIHEDGYRPNVGIILCNRDHQVFWARRCGRDAWQFPQGGIKQNESPEQALYRELYEEVGLNQAHVALMGRTREWLHYEIPEKFRRAGQDGSIVGQKQVWFLLRLIARDDTVRLDCSAKPEFDDWQWVDYWHPVDRVIDFKREVYHRALTELEPLLTAQD